jgi:tetratricopeptide (TPR) repeat protein
MHKRSWMWIVAAALLVSSAGCNQAVTEHGRKLCAEALAAFDRGEYELTVTHMDAFLRESSQSSSAGRAYYLRGLAHHRLKQRDEAKSDLIKAVARSKDRTVRANALTAMGDIAWERKDVKSSESYFRQALEFCERDVAPAGHVYYQLGCVLQHQGRWKAADEQFRKAVHYFPRTLFSDRSGRRVNARMWIVRAGAFGLRGAADMLAAELKSGGLRAVSRADTTTTERLVFVVDVGEYETYPQAEAALKGVRKHKPKAFVTVAR